MFNKKTLSTTLAFLLVLSIAVPLISSSANAQTLTEYTTYPFVEAIPNPVGKGQTSLINFGLINYLNEDGDGWNVTLTIKAPDGTETKVDRMTWSTGTVGYSFTPDQTGTYILKTSFEEVEYSYMGWFGPVNGLYLASESDEYELVVQDDAVPYHPGHALPSEYWTRPIDSQLREWYSIAGSWVATPLNLYAPFNDAPESAHILWTRPIGDTMGGLATGETGVHGYGTGDAYEGKWAGSIIISGVLYYNKHASGEPQQEVVAVDLHTGEELWTKSLANTDISTGQILYWDCLNYRGAFSYIWVASGGGWSFGPGGFITLPENWHAYDPLTGEWQFNVTNIPGGTSYRGPNGEILKYEISNGRLLRWNLSHVITAGKSGMDQSWGSQVQGNSYNGTRGYDLNVSIPALPSNSIIYAFPGDMLLGGNVTKAGVTLWGLNLKEGQEGQLLFSNTWTASSEWASLPIGEGMQNGWAAFSTEDDVAVYWTRENRVQWGFSLKDGKFLWQTAPQDYKDAWSDTPTLSFGPEKIIAYNKLYSASLGGVIYCYDITNGKLLWNYTAEDPYTESYIGNAWWLVPTFISDGKLYVGHMEHSAMDPKPRGAPFLCLNAEDGTLIWEIDGAFRQSRWGGRAIIGDSIIATQDTYDQRIYAIGKGPSAMTVTAPDTAVSFDTPVIIKGTITDVSPGTEDAAIKLRFPNGIPAVSDEYMSDWMLYVYKQFSQPSDATGVKVSLAAVDPNNNYIEIGDTTSDSAGTFSYMWTPETPGKYTIYATFEGSASYYSSYAQTAMGVQEAIVTPEPSTSQSVTEQYFVPAIAGIIVAIIVVGLVLALLVRRRP